MKAVWKFTVAIKDTQKVAMPKGAQLLDAQIQGGVPCLWSIVDVSAPLETRVFEVYGTGHPLPDNAGSDGLAYVATFHAPPLVWHLFERTEQ